MWNCVGRCLAFQYIYMYEFNNVCLNIMFLIISVVGNLDFDRSQWLTVHVLREKYVNFIWGTGGSMSMSFLY